MGLEKPGGRACEYTQRIAGAFAACILEVWRPIDSDNKMEVDTRLMRVLHICDKHKHFMRCITILDSICAARTLSVQPGCYLRLSLTLSVGFRPEN